MLPTQIIPDLAMTESVENSEKSLPGWLLITGGLVFPAPLAEFIIHAFADPIATNSIPDYPNHVAKIRYRWSVTPEPLKYTWNHVFLR